MRADNADIAEAGRHAHGRFLVSRRAAEPRAVAQWIRAQGYTAHETEERRVKRHGRARNILYEVRPDFAPHPLIMKVSAPSERYLLRRRLELQLRQLVGDYGDYGLSAFRACCALSAAGASVAEPVAWWQHNKGLFRRKSYFLYRKVDAALSVAELLATDEADDLSPAVIDKLTTLVRAIHAANWRHRDLQMNNVLVSGDGAGRWSAARVRESAFTVVDYDACSKSRPRPRALKRLLDLRCLIFVHAPGVTDERMLAAYLGAPPTPLQNAALRFWKNGGFSLARRAGRRRKRRRGAHLKPR